MKPLSFERTGIRWIAFDAVGTLIDPNPSAAEIYHRIGVRHGSRLALDDVASRFREAFSQVERDGILPCGCPGSVNLLHTCETRERLRWQTIVETVLDDVASREACFQELFVHFGRATAWRCFPEVERALAALRKSGFRLAVSSNFDSRLHAVMDAIEPLRPIELRLISSEIGYRKPSPRFFQSLLAATACAASEILFVGDDLQNDIEAAKALGLHALQIDRSDAEGDNLRSLAEVVDRLRVS